MSWCGDGGAIIREASTGLIVGGKYCLKKLLNMGNFAYSYKGIDKSGNAFFIKEYVDPKNISAQKEEFNSFKKHLTQVKDKLSGVKNVASQIIEIIVDGPMLYTVHEFMDGMDMESYFSRNKVKFEDRVLFSLIFLSSLMELHNNGIVHSDLKLAQIFLKRDETINLGWRTYMVDFDFCYLYDKSGNLISSPFKVVGTIPYYSPEHIKGELPSFKSDVFTAGIVVSLILSGKHPYMGSTDYDMDIVKGNFSLDFSGISVPSEIEAIVKEMLSPDPEKRPEMKIVVDKFLKWRNNLNTPAKVLRVPHKKSSPVSISRNVLNLEDVKSKKVLKLRQGEIGKRNFRLIAGAKYSTLPEKIFSLKKVGEMWYINTVEKNVYLYVNGKKVSGGIRIKIGDEVRVDVGEVVYSFRVK